MKLGNKDKVSLYPKKSFLDTIKYSNINTTLIITILIITLIIVFICIMQIPPELA